MSADLPFFRYHPDPLASGSIRAAADTCACCNRSTGWICTATFCTAHEVDGPFCPWCIADGSAAQRFAGEFADSYGLAGVGEEITWRRDGCCAGGRTTTVRDRSQVPAAPPRSRCSSAAE
ncbi:CbrC family protein [Streptomyces sp. NPDC058457]|uniref:CbrC family protein n=1 Tax=Streptomyces sp. NPDC058457 TaxID=3346507 RepID=UPI00366526FA